MMVREKIKWNISGEGSVLENPIPNIEEQRMISMFFNNIDNLITLHQCVFLDWHSLLDATLK